MLARVLRLAANAPPALADAVIPIIVLGTGGSEELSPALEGRMRAFFFGLGVTTETSPEEVRQRLEAWSSADPDRAAWIAALQEILDEAGAEERGARLGRGAASLGIREDLRPTGQREAPAGTLRGGGGLVELFLRRNKAP